jgi:hypothetical protein
MRRSGAKLVRKLVSRFAALALGLACSSADPPVVLCFGFGFGLAAGFHHWVFNTISRNTDWRRTAPSF